MCIAFVQRTGQETRVIDYYQAEGFGFDHYARKLQELAGEKKYVYGRTSRRMTRITEKADRQDPSFSSRRR